MTKVWLADIEPFDYLNLYLDLFFGLLLKKKFNMHVGR
jgi:hypothetical protein